MLPDRSEFDPLAALLNNEEHRRWLERPYLFIFPMIDVIAAFVAAESVRFYMVGRFSRRCSALSPSHCEPYMIPFAIAIEEAAAPHSGLAFMFLERGHLRLCAGAALHRDQLQRLSEQGPANHRPLLKRTRKECLNDTLYPALDWRGRQLALRRRCN